MLKERKVGPWYQIEGRVAGNRIRLALRTKNEENAHKTVREIESALERGPDSGLWPRLRDVLPKKTFESLAAIAGYREQPLAPEPTWQRLVALFESDARRRIA